MTAPSFDVYTYINKHDWDYAGTIDSVPFNHKIEQMPYSFSDAELQQLKQTVPSVTLLYPEFETVTDPVESLSRARGAGLDVVVALRAGHLLAHERPAYFSSKIAELLLK